MSKFKKSKENKLRSVVAYAGVIARDDNCRSYCTTSWRCGTEDSQYVTIADQYHASLLYKYN